MNILKLLFGFIFFVMLLKVPSLLYFVVIYVGYKAYPYFKKNSNFLFLTRNMLQKFCSKDSDDIDKSSDTDAINETNFMKINHKDRKQFFKGNYFIKGAEDRYGKVRRMETIEPIYIEYENSQGEFSKRKLELFGIKTFEGSIFFYGFCHRKGEGRTFNCRRIKLLIDKNNNRYVSEAINDYIKTQLVPHIASDYNKKVVLNCLE